MAAKKRRKRKYSAKPNKKHFLRKITEYQTYNPKSERYETYSMSDNDYDANSHKKELTHRGYKPTQKIVHTIVTMDKE